jgi:hypothetical protein
VVVDPGALDAAAGSLAEAGRWLHDDVAPLRSAADAASVGAGELAGELAAGVAAFRTSWEAALRTAAASTELVGGNVRRARAEYERVDAAVLRPGPR